MALLPILRADRIQLDAMVRSDFGRRDILLNSKARAVITWRALRHIYGRNNTREEIRSDIDLAAKNIDEFAVLLVEAAENLGLVGPSGNVSLRAEVDVRRVITEISRFGGCIYPWCKK